VAGFDATSAHSLCLVEAPDDRPHLQPAIAAEILRNVFYLPAYPTIPVSELKRMSDLVAMERLAAGLGSTSGSGEHPG
jgi:hypothetical protein